MFSKINNLYKIIVMVLFCTYSIQEIQQVTVLFRHGDRAPDKVSVYPKDPYKNSTYYPIGYGQHTTKGKQRIYSVGQLVRARYNKFLGNIYLPGQVNATTPNLPRHKVALQLLLAGAYPPQGTVLEWNPILNWNPIPYTTSSYTKDMWLTLSHNYCPKYIKLYKKYAKSQEVRLLLKKYTLLNAYLSEKTGKNISTVLAASNIYIHLRAQEAFGYELPRWTKSVYPNILQQTVIDSYKTFVATPELIQVSGGLLLKKIINGMNDHIRNSTKYSENLKLILYSAHDINLIYMAGTLKQTIVDEYGYGAFFIFELVKISDTYYVQVYQNYGAGSKLTQVTPVLIPGCLSFRCPLQRFSEVLQDNIPNSGNACFED